MRQILAFVLVLLNLSLFCQTTQIVGLYKSIMSPDSSYSAYNFTNDSSFILITIRPKPSPNACNNIDSGKWELKRKHILLRFKDSTLFDEKLSIIEDKNKKVTLVSYNFYAVYRIRWLPLIRFKKWNPEYYNKVDYMESH